jgi:hypothetical protein
MSRLYYSDTKRLNLSTYPHHKHQGSEDNVLACEAPDLATVLIEIIENYIEPLWPFEFTR